MTDQVSITNLPDSGSKERVAYDMMLYLRNHVPKGDEKERLQNWFDLYEQCLTLTRGGSGNASKVIK